MTSSPVLKLSASPSIMGTNHAVRVGSREYRFPSGLRFAHSQFAGQKGLWVLDEHHGQHIYFFTEQGEVTGIPPEVIAYARKKIFKLVGKGAAET